MDTSNAMDFFDGQFDDEFMRQYPEWLAARRSRQANQSSSRRNVSSTDNSTSFYSLPPRSSSPVSAEPICQTIPRQDTMDQVLTRLAALENEVQVLKDRITAKEDDGADEGCGTRQKKQGRPAKGLLGGLKRDLSAEQRGTRDELTVSIFSIYRSSLCCRAPKKLTICAILRDV